MKKNFWAWLLCTALLLSGLMGCGRDDCVQEQQSSPEVSSSDVTGIPSAPQDQELEPNLRVVSMNVRMVLLPTTGTRLDNRSQNRVRAVREQLLSYEPDLIGLQEDVQRWIDNIKIDRSSTRLIARM